MGKRFHRERIYLKFARRKWLQDVRSKFLSRDPRCHYCERDLSYKNSTLDHKVPIKNGGLDQEQNLVLSCRPCNKLKETISYKKFMKMTAHKRNDGFVYEKSYEHRKCEILAYRNYETEQWRCTFNHPKTGKKQNTDQYKQLKFAVTDAHRRINDIVCPEPENRLTVEKLLKSGFRGPKVVRIEEPEPLERSNMAS